MNENKITAEYFEWLCNMVCEGRFARNVSFRKLLAYLFETEFVYLMPKDSNRADDGMELRYQFAYEHAGVEDAELYLDGPCNMLEMMVALARRCEENIMDNPEYGNRLGQWFWQMVNSLGLSGMTDDAFDKPYVDEVIDTFLDRQYKANGRGGLFTIKGCKYDLRNVEIWYQLCWYLDSIS